MSTAKEKVTLLVQGINFNCYKSDLSNASDYFQAMFSENFSEKGKDVIELQEVDPYALEQILNLIKDKNFAIDDNLLLSMLQTSSMLQFTEVQEICALNLKKKLSFTNCLSVVNISYSCGIQHLWKTARTMSLWYFEDIIKRENFLQLSFKELKDYLGDPALNTGVSGEWSIWEAIELWVQHSEEDRFQYLPSLIQAIDFERFTAVDISSLTFYSLVNDCPETLSILKEIKAIKLNAIEGESSKQRKLALNILSKPGRFCPELACVVGFKELRSDEIDELLPFYSVLYGFNPTTRTLQEVVDLSKMSNPMNCSGYRVCSVGPVVYIFGGEYYLGHNNWNLHIWCYNTLTERWSTHTPMPRNRRHHFCCVIGSTVYLLSGYGKHRIPLTAVDAYDTVADKWKKCAEMPEPNHGGTACVHQNKIYMFGCRKIFVYNPEIDEWFSTKYKSKTNRGFNISVSYKNFIFLVENFSRNLYQYDETTSVIAKVGEFQYKVSNVCRVGSKLYNFSQTGEDLKQVIESIDLSNIDNLKSEWEWQEYSSSRNLFISTPHDEQSYCYGCFPLFSM